MRVLLLCHIFDVGNTMSKLAIASGRTLAFNGIGTFRMHINNTIYESGRTLVILFIQSIAGHRDILHDERASPCASRSEMNATCKIKYTSNPERTTAHDASSKQISSGMIAENETITICNEQENHHTIILRDQRQVSKRLRCFIKLQNICKRLRKQMLVYRDFFVIRTNKTLKKS